MAASEAERLFGSSVIAGPMVRGSSHAFRCTCLSYGADVVFSPGLVDLSLNRAVRKDENGHVELWAEGSGHTSCVFQTCPAERSHLVLQLVSNDSANAIAAVRKLEDVIAGVDLNCGCPENFAVHRGCGSAIDVESASDILKALTRTTTKPVSVKFRVEHDVERSVQFARAVEAAGACAITIHGRVKEQKHQGEVDSAKMRTVFESVSCLKVGNGGVKSLAEAARMRAETGCHSVMICSAAMKNPSVFSPNPVSEMDAFAEMCKIGKGHGLASTNASGAWNRSPTRQRAWHGSSAQSSANARAGRRQRPDSLKACKGLTSSQLAS
jgi:tRNA-dihydrouridine synthase 2